MRVIGTAGHVDHGKSTLVEALTGTHPDRLKEEREREMTIDLGFAWMILPGGEEIGIVDVPGHRDFIENMLAGVGGIDAALFVIAADEGVMPQTREHLAILDLLQVQGGVVALTKIDLLGEGEARAEWLELVEDDVRSILAGTVLQEAAICRVSARTGEGVPALKLALEECLSGRPPRPDLGKPRLPVDRIFTVAGFGTVVTGTLSGGSLKAGDEVEVLPQGIRGRVRGLQTHKRKESVAVPGSRTAVNISGVDVDQIQRGNVIAHPGDYAPTRRIDARFRLLPDASQPVEHNIQVKLFTGAAEVLARLRLLGAEALQPGAEGWLQLELEAPVTAARGDRYILRRPSPGETLGGGVIVDPHPKGRHRRFNAEVLARLETLSQGTPAEIFQQALEATGSALLPEVIRRSNLDESAALAAASELLETGGLVDLENRRQGNLLPPEALVAGRGFWQSLKQQAVDEVEAFHQAYPLRAGMPREELRSRLKLPARTSQAQRLYAALTSHLVSAGELVDMGPLVRRPGHAIRFNSAQQRQVEALLERFKSAPYSPPSVKESQAQVSEEVFTALVDLGTLVQLSPEVVFRQPDYERMVTAVRELIRTHGPITAAQVRDHFNTSRKYVLAFLEHLDATGVTQREGDTRRLK